MGRDYLPSLAKQVIKTIRNVLEGNPQASSKVKSSTLVPSLFHRTLKLESGGYRSVGHLDKTPKKMDAERAALPRLGPHD